MSGGDGESVTSQIQAAEAKADDIIRNARQQLSDIESHQADPLIDYEETIDELASDIESATDGLRLGTEELEIVRQRTRILRRIDIAVNAQLKAHQRATEQRLAYLDDWIEDLRAFAISMTADTTPAEEHEQKLTPLSDWVQKAIQYTNADRHAELVATDGAHTLSELQARIETVEEAFRSDATTEEEHAYLGSLCVSEIDYLQRVIERLERVVTTNGTYSVDGLKADVQAASSRESLLELLGEIRDQRQSAIKQADAATETAMTLDALAESGFEHSQMEDLHDEAMENLRHGDIETARRQTGKLLEWETELEPIDRFEIALSEYDGDVLRIVEQTGFSIDDALEHISALYQRAAVDDITVQLK